MATRKRDEMLKTDDKPSAPTSGAEAKVVRKPKVGDVVMYAHRPMTEAENVPSSFPVPLMVTTTFEGSNIVNGVVFSDNRYLGFTGYKVVQDIPQGDGPGEWQHRS